MKLRIHIEMPEPGKQKYPIPDREKSLEEEIRYMIDCIESGHDSSVEWRALNRLYKVLRTKKSPRAKRLIEMMEPTLQKYGVHGVPEVDQ